MLDNIPAEMRAFKQFVLWRYEERGGTKPTKVPYSVGGYMANVNNPAHWTDYDTAVNMLRSSDKYAGLGFVLTRNDPFGFIDLDDPSDDSKGYTAEQTKEILDRQIKIHQMFDSYSERSPSGRGLHIIVKGSVEQGRKRAQIEVYTSERFMTMTGDTFNDCEIKEQNELLNQLWSEMGKDVKVYTEFGDRPQTMSDGEVCDRAYAASNGTKFYDLYCGQWEQYYTSQSEADFALVDIVAFYTQNREQITRIFRASALGQRPKAHRNDYVEFMLNRCFDHMLPPVDIEGLKIQIEAALMAKRKAEEQAAEEQRMQAELVAAQQRESYTVVASTVETTKPKVYDKPKARYPLPPGMLGEIAEFIHAAAIRPVPDIALAAAIGLMSGVCGRAYNISGTGLNTYIILVATTGVGKDAIAGGIDLLTSAVKPMVPNADLFIGPGDIASPQALQKHFHRHSKSFVAMPGEIGLWMQRICNPLAGPADRGVMKMMLELYSQSGNNKIFKASINSDKEKSTDAVKSPGFSLLGESTPEEFYAALSEGTISSGLVPRFSVVEYRGKRPRKNKHPATVPSDSLIKNYATLCTNALSLNEVDRVINVGYTPEGLALLDKWDEFCDSQINLSVIGEDVKKQLWNRAHMNALKLAALVAVGVSPYTPTIDEECANWAINIVNDNVSNIIDRFARGEIGSNCDESRQEHAAVDIIRHFVTSSFSEIASYNVMRDMHSERVIPFAYLSTRLSKHAVFRGDRRGPTAAVHRTLSVMLERGDITELPKHDLGKRFGVSSRAFMITKASTFGL